MLTTPRRANSDGLVVIVFIRTRPSDLGNVMHCNVGRYSKSCGLLTWPKASGSSNERAYPPQQLLGFGHNPARQLYRAWLLAWAIATLEWVLGRFTIGQLCQIAYHGHSHPVVKMISTGTPLTSRWYELHNRVTMALVCELTKLSYYNQWGTNRSAFGFSAALHFAIKAHHDIYIMMVYST